MSYSRHIALGVAAGVAAGVVFGEMTAGLHVVAEAYVKLLQMTVLPYVMVSIIAGLGALGQGQAGRLAARGGAVLLLLWGVALGAVFVFPLMLPPQQAASFFSTSLLQPREPFDLVALYIPANPFHSLANNVVPAVVLFSVLLGAALVAVPGKQALLDVLAVVGAAIARINALVARMMPYGLFVITATVAGTLNLEELQRLQVYLVAYIVVALVVSLWVLPGLVAALTPIPFRAVLDATRDALLTAFMAGNLFIVLPMLTQAARALVRVHISERPETEALPEVIVPVSFNFPHVGKILTLTFVLFAGWFADQPVAAADYPRLGVTGLLVLFGNITMAVPFLLDLMRIPADTFHLFEATSVVNSRFGTLVAAMHTAVIGILGACAMAGGLRVQGRRLATFAGVTVVVGLAAIGSVRVLVGEMLAPGYDRDRVIASMQMLNGYPPATEYAGVAQVPDVDGAAAGLDRIRRRGSLRVGYLPDSLPYAYRNASGRLVGLDVEMAHALADELGVRLELVAVDRWALADRLDAGVCDVVMSGLAATPARAAELRLTGAYLDETLAFIVRDELRDDFTTWEAVRSRGALTLKVPNVPYYQTRVRAELPEAQLIVVDEVRELFVQSASSDPVVLTAERGSTWTLLNPSLSVVVPQPSPLKVPLAYALSLREPQLGSFVTAWVELKRKDGTVSRLFDYWILGKTAEQRQRRWSVWHDLLRWP